MRARDESACFCGYRDVSTTALRAMLATYRKLGVLSAQRLAIVRELAHREEDEAVRAWAADVERNMHRLIRWCRGGLS